MKSSENTLSEALVGVSFESMPRTRTRCSNWKRLLEVRPFLNEDIFVYLMGRRMGNGGSTFQHLKDVNRSKWKWETWAEFEFIFGPSLQGDMLLKTSSSFLWESDFWPCGSINPRKRPSIFHIHRCQTTWSSALGLTWWWAAIRSVLGPRRFFFFCKTFKIFQVFMVITKTN